MKNISKYIKKNIFFKKEIQIFRFKSSHHPCILTNFLIFCNKRGNGRIIFDPIFVSIWDFKGPKQAIYCHIIFIVHFFWRCLQMQQLLMGDSILKMVFTIQTLSISCVIYPRLSEILKLCYYSLPAGL